MGKNKNKNEDEDEYDVAENQMATWMSQWEKASADWEKEDKKKPPREVERSFFTGTPYEGSYESSPANGDPSNEEIDDWMDVYNKSLQYEEDLINENKRLHREARARGGKDAEDDDDEEEAGFGHLVRGNKQMTKGDITYQNQPQHFSSIGPDAAPYDGPNRVTRSMTNKALEGLDEMRRKLEVMERRVHRSEVLGESAKKKALKNELASLRKEVHKLSELIQSKPDKDVT